jgi:hypothetical protein
MSAAFYSLHSRLLWTLSAAVLLSACLAGCSGEEAAEDDFSAEETADVYLYEETPQTAYESSPEEDAVIPAPYQLGSAGYIDQPTVIVSIFADNADCQWDFTSREDQQLQQNVHDRMAIGISWLEESILDWGLSANFIYDWEENPDLLMHASFPQQPLTRDRAYYDSVNAWVKENVPTAQLKTEYAAGNIIYAFFFRTPWNFQSFTNHTTFAGDLIRNPAGLNEIMTFFSCFRGHEEMPGVYAHEILHCFGAPDLYDEAAEETYGLTAEIRDAAQAEFPEDIMLGDGFDPETGEPVFDDVPTEITELTAYYVGLTDECDFQMQHDLAESQYLQLEETAAQ